MSAWVAGATIGAAVIGSAASSKASKAQQQASDTAAAASRETTQASIEAQERMFNKQVALQEPFRETGLAAQNRLADLLGVSGRTSEPGYGYAMQPFTMAQYQADPGYAFRLRRGVDALDRTAAARGGLLSGNQLRGVTEFGQDLASQEYQNAFNRYQTERSNVLNPLQSLGGVGQSSTNTLTNAAGNLGAGMAGAYGNLGNALSANAMNTGNIRASGYMNQANAITGALGTGLNYYQNQQMMDRYFPQRDAELMAIGNSTSDYGSYRPRR
jgi:hypothetical protein